VIVILRFFPTAYIAHVDFVMFHSVDQICIQKQQSPKAAAILLRIADNIKYYAGI
jgi:phosphoribosylaminoimidazole carboxylase (NCAIR synthetase)